jgi:hypothetical protein
MEHPFGNKLQWLGVLREIRPQGIEIGSFFIWLHKG